METSHSQVPPISLILKKISDDKALVLFNSIAVTNEDKYIPLKEMNLTTKQYYTRVSGLLDAGLVKRRKGKYSLTTLGKVVYQSQTIIGKTLAYYWKLKAIESLETSASGSYIPPSEEIKQMINALIDNQQIKDILMKSIFNTTVENGSNHSRQQL
jgi:hypothetical protein